ncbi:MAG: trehalose-6-phosphate synthase [Kofleriaceae bacterium]|nr:trehalose-6-phosphate synthase [Kofleriaceae bacterium]
MVLLLGALVIVGAGYFVLVRTTRQWFASDLTLRTNLAIEAASESLATHWGDNSEALRRTLVSLTRDERIMAAAACSASGSLVAASDAYPDSFSCETLRHRAHREHNVEQSWSFVADLPSGRVHVGIVPVRVGKGGGFVVLMHDLSYLDRREATTRWLLVAAFLLVTIGAVLLTMMAARIAWREWTQSLRNALGGNGRAEFLPLLRDVQEMAERLSNEQNREQVGGSWSPERLRATLRQHLEGERIVVLANREPYVHQKTATGMKVLHPASGLVTALEPVMRACSGVWVAHGSGSGDRETVDVHDRVAVPPDAPAYMLRRVWLTEAEENGYYYGFANEGLWPLCHVAHARPTFRAEDWAHYVAVNQRFADAVCEEVDVEDPIILVQDYHFALAPKMIRARLPQATILTFWHTPWPNAERIGICPWREELIEGLLGSSIIGFQTQQHCNNFIDSVDAFVESRIDRETKTVVQGQRRTGVRPYPISIEWPVHWLPQVPPVAQSRSLVRKELGLASDALLGVGVDRLDYTKGIEERLLAVDEMLLRYPEFRGRFTFVQLAAPSRTKIERYRELNDRVEAVAAKINATWGSGTYSPIILLRAHHEPLDVFRYYRAAEVCYVSSLHDGMNLVAKEFVAARDDEQGVLVLSQFTGAARELSEALIVNPYDLRHASDALAVGLKMPANEQRERMRSMRRLVAEFNVYRWAGQMLVDAAEVRRKERMFGRFPKRFFQKAAL